MRREERDTNCCYAQQDTFWGDDPDGVGWEVYYFHADAEFNDPRYQAQYDAAASSQCAPAVAPTTPAAALHALAPMAFPPAAVETVVCAPGGGGC